MSDLFLPVQGKDYQLSGSGVTSTATSVTVKKFETPQGTELSMANFGDTGYGTFEPGTVREENFSFTGVTQNGDSTATLTGVTRGLNFVSPYTQDTSLRQQHAGGTIMRLSNSAPFYNEITGKDNDETITGKWTFPATGSANEVVVADASTPPTANEALATKKYVDDTAIYGAPDATNSVKGIVFIGSQTEVNEGDDSNPNGTASNVVTPSTLAVGVQNAVWSYAADAEASDTYAITITAAPTAYATGQVFYFKANTANTGAATLNVNSLGAITIKKNHDQDLETGDIESGSLVLVQYDGTNFQMLNQQASMPTTALLTEMSDFFSTTNITGAEAETLSDGSNADALHYHQNTLDFGVNTATSDEYSTSILSAPETWAEFGVDTTVHAGWMSTYISGANVDITMLTLVPPYSGSGREFGDNPNTLRLKWRLQLAPSAPDSGEHNGVGLIDDLSGGATEIYDTYTSVNKNIRFVADQNQDIYVCVGDGSNNTNSKVGTGNADDWHTYEIIWDYGNAIYFYLDGTLVATVNANMPTAAANEDWAFGAGCTARAGTAVALYTVGSPTVSLKLS